MARKKHRKAGTSRSQPFQAVEFQFPLFALRLAVPALVALFAAIAWSERGIHEDGFFYLRVVDVFLHTGELAYNPGERFETNTDFLWTLLLIPGPALGLDPVLWLQIAGLLVHVAALLAIFVLARKLLGDSEFALAALILLGAHYSFAHFATTGFGTVLQALAALCCLLALLRFGKSANLRSGTILGCALSFLALCRLDSAVLGAPVALCALFFAWRSGNAARTGLVAALGIPALAAALLLLWKQSYYGDIFPATYYIKGTNVYAGVDIQKERLERGAGYLLLYWRVYFLWALAAAAAFGFWRARRGPAKNRRDGREVRIPLLLTMAGMVVLWHAYTIRVGGDFVEFRFMMPQAPMLMILLAAGLSALPRLGLRVAVAAAALVSFAHMQETSARAEAGDYALSPAGIDTVRGDWFETVKIVTADGSRLDVAPDSHRIGLAHPVRALAEMFRHLGPYPSQVRLGFQSGGSASFSTRLLLTETYGYADSRIGNAAPEDVVFQESGWTGHNTRALPHLLARIGVNLIPHIRSFPAPPDYERPFIWAANVVLPGALNADNLRRVKLPDDSQLFTLRTEAGHFLPVLYFNRNETIDRVLDERGIERVNVF